HHFGDSPNHQGASTRINIASGVVGVTPYGKNLPNRNIFLHCSEHKQAKKREPPFWRLPQSSGCIYKH
ncbi:MAG: hypothetical protein AB4290_19755, partial [Spirulina sp.]